MVRERMNTALTIAAEGGRADIAKSMKGLGPGVVEIVLRYRTDAYRAVYVTEIAGVLWVVHAFQKKSKRGIKTPKFEVDLIAERLKRLRGANAMSEDEFELIRGSGNVFRDLGDPDADIKQAKSILAAQIISVLEEKALSVRKAAGMTGFAAADFSRVRNADLGRFTLDRLIKMLRGLDESIEVTIRLGS